MKLNIAYACDDNYIMQTGISMISLLENNKSFDEIEFFLIDFGIKKESLERIDQIVEHYGRTWRVIPFETWSGDFHVQNLGRHIASVYAKIFFGRLAGIDKILYLDSDIIVEDSLEDLWKKDLSRYWIAGVETISSIKRNQKMGLEAKDVCINDGMLLMNLEQWRKDAVEERCLSYIEEQRGEPFVLSEGTLNHVCNHHILRLHPRYNLMSGLVYYKSSEIEQMTGRPFYSQKVMDDAKENPCIIHYLCGCYMRPWNIDCKHPMKDIYRKYKELSPWKDVPDTKAELSPKLKLLDTMHKVLPNTLFCNAIRWRERKRS